MFEPVQIAAILIVAFLVAISFYAVFSRSKVVDDEGSLNYVDLVRQAIGEASASGAKRDDILDFVVARVLAHYPKIDQAELRKNVETYMAVLNMVFDERGDLKE